MWEASPVTYLHMECNENISGKLKYSLLQMQISYNFSSGYVKSDYFNKQCHICKGFTYPEDAYWQTRLH